MDVFPAAFPLQGLTVAVAGDGEAALAKARLFAGSPARVLRLYAAEAHDPARYRGARLAFIAVEAEAAARAAVAARAAGTLVNVVDRPELCDFTTPAIVDRGAVVGAVMTGGAAPLLAAELRREIEARWPAELGEAAALLAALQPELRAAIPAVADRRAWLRRLLDGEAPGLAMRGERAAALALARAGLADGAGPGRLALLVPPTSADLLSLRALQALGRADRLVLAPGVDPALAAMARRDAPVVVLADVRAEDIAAEVAGGAHVICIGARAEFQRFGSLETLPVASNG